MIDFTCKWPGALTGDIVVTPSVEPLNDPALQRSPDDIDALPAGSYRIGWFVDRRRDIWWRLVDDAAESECFLRSIPEADLRGLAIRRHPYHWYASTYSAPLDGVMREAAANFTDTFERYVIPALARHT